MDEAMGKTEHRLRQRRKAMRGFFQYRKFTKDEAVPSHMCKVWAQHTTKRFSAE